jgi:hypothetical protein
MPIMAGPGSPSVRLRRGVVRAVTASRPGARELLVAVEDEGEAAAIAYPSLVGPVEQGDRVLLNTTAVRLGLGTGGMHIVVAIEGEGDVDLAHGGRAMKLRYTPHQLAVEAIEERVELPEALPATPVVWIPLHSLLAPVAAGAVAAGAGSVAFVMTDGAALPAGLSRLTHQLREAGLLSTVVTAGQAFDGDIEAVNPFTGMLAASDADVIVVGDGPGNLGTETTWGASALGSAMTMNAAAILGGRPLAALRISFADARERHRGVSHHSLTALAKVALVPVHVAVPTIEDEDRRRRVWDALRSHRLEERHQLVEVAGEPALDLLRDRGIEARSMGRTIQDDPLFFLAGGAAGILAGRMAVRDRAWRAAIHSTAPPENA